MIPVEVSVGSSSYEWWDLVPAIVGGIIGALAGGIPAWLLAKRQSDETLRRDKAQRTERQKALAFSVAVKLIKLVNEIVGLSNHVKGCLALRSLPDHAHMEPWQALIPMIGHSPEDAVRFTSEEMAVFAAAGENDLMQDMMLLAERNAASLKSFVEYCKMRNEFREIGPKPEAFDGQIGSALLTQEEVNSFKPYTIPLNNVAVGLHKGLDKDVDLARSVTEKFGPTTAKMFGVDRFADLSFPNEAELQEMRGVPDANTA